MLWQLKKSLKNTTHFIPRDKEGKQDFSKQTKDKMYLWVSDSSVTQFKKSMDGTGGYGFISSNNGFLLLKKIITRARCQFRILGGFLFALVLIQFYNLILQKSGLEDTLKYI